MKKLCLIITNIILIFALASCDFFIKKDNENDEVIEYNQIVSAESNLYVNNPDQGFYSPVCIQVVDDFKDKDYVINNNTRLYHLRMDLSTFSSKYNRVEDKLLGKNDLASILSILAKYLNKEKSVVIRFAYDHNYEGSKNMEPSIDIMLEHIKQLAPVLNKYEDCITAIEAGLIGPWGEMHSSECAKAENINLIIDTFLNNINNIPILVRTPKMIYNYLGISINDISTYTIAENSKSYRLSLFNDGYLGSSNDLGTYTNRELETSWLAKQTNHLPYGGEVVVPNSTLHDIDKCIPEMKLMHLSYLNQAWNDQVISKWKNATYSKDCGDDELFYGTSFYNYIQAHLGYRFVLSKSTLIFSEDNIKISLEIENKGFGNLLRAKSVDVYALYDDGTLEKYEGLKTNDLTSLELTIPNLSKKGTLYLSITNDNDTYPVRLANEDIYNEELKANLIGIIE